MEPIPIYELYLPEYEVHEEPNHRAVGKKVDDFIKQHYLGRHV